MIENTQHLSVKQKEAFINEYKGHLFEFLVAYNMATAFNIQNKFYQTFSSSQMSTLKIYEKEIFYKDKELFFQLKELASIVAQKVMMYLQAKKKSSVKDIYLIGKMVEGGKKKWGEGDILLISENQKQLPISLKLCKDNAFINTKNAGVRSFLKKYFYFTEASLGQDELNERHAFFYAEMAKKMHLKAKLPEQISFGGDWERAGFSKLPGELSRDMRQILFEYYHQIIQEIYHYLKGFQKESSKLLASSLLPLCGLDQKDLLQVMCTYDNIKKVLEEKRQRYHFKKIYINHYADVKEKCLSRDYQIEIPQDNLSSFEVVWDFLRLQIRVKPMNRFTDRSVKINCSIKYT